MVRNTYHQVIYFVDPINVKNADDGPLVIVAGILVRYSLVYVKMLTRRSIILVSLRSIAASMCTAENQIC